MAGGGKNGRDLYQIHLTGKVIDNTNKGLSVKKLNRIANQISKQVQSSFSGKGDGIEFKATADITAVSETNPLTASDHAFRIVDDVAKILDKVDPPGTNTAGFAQVGQNVVYIENGVEYSRIGTHELGHSAGLGHPKDEINLSTGMPYTTNDFPGNLMHQGQDVNSNGEPVAGTKLEPWQIKKIQKMYDIGALNRGKQE